MDHAKSDDGATSEATAPATHQAIDHDLCGRPLELAPGFSRVELVASERMAVDERGLVHGGFPFGLADHAAMLAVNDPLVVLAAAEVRFLRPVRVGERLVAEARLDDGDDDGNGNASDPTKPQVEVVVERDGVPVFTGAFQCFVPEDHVLEDSGAGE